MLDFSELETGDLGKERPCSYAECGDDAAEFVARQCGMRADASSPHIAGTELAVIDPDVVPDPLKLPDPPCHRLSCDRYVAHCSCRRCVLVAVSHSSCIPIRLHRQSADRNLGRFFTVGQVAFSVKHGSFLSSRGNSDHIALAFFRNGTERRPRYALHHSSGGASRDSASSALAEVRSNLRACSADARGFDNWETIVWANDRASREQSARVYAVQHGVRLPAPASL